METPTPGVIIDANVPRDELERCQILLDYFASMDDSPGHKRVVASLHGSYSIVGDLSVTELEDEILACINAKLPDDLVCTLGEFQPGDVVIREVGDEAEEML